MPVLFFGVAHCGCFEAQLTHGLAALRRMAQTCKVRFSSCMWLCRAGG